MRSRHSVEEKFEIVMEALTENTTQAEICRRHGIFPTQLAKWKEQFIESGKKGLSDGRHPHSSKEEIDDISRFKSKEKFASYSGLVLKQYQSGSRDLRGHISKRGPSMLRFVLVNASHTAIKKSKRLRAKYLSLVRRVGRNRAIVAIARILAELIFTMLKNNKEFIDKIDSLTERKMKSMAEKARNAKASERIAQSVKIIRKKLLTRSSEDFFIGVQEEER